MDSEQKTNIRTNGEITDYKAFHSGPVSNADAAEHLKEKLAELRPELKGRAADWFPDYQIGLLDETIGLFGAIQKKTVVTKGVPQIRNNLLEILRHLESHKQLTSDMGTEIEDIRSDACSVVTQTLQYAALHGFSIEGCDIAAQRSRHR